MKYLSLFSGIGGFELGIQQAYESHNEHAHLGAESEQEERSQGREWPLGLDGIQLHAGDRAAPLCIGYSEIDKYATAIYQSHFPNHINYGDITTINAQDLPDFDLLVGGFPCQAFSIAGKRGGFSDTRGTLFFEIARIAREKQPRLLLLENVKGLLSHDQGRTFRTIIRTLDELGYDCQWQVLNSKNHGVPQNRERVFIVGHLRGTPRPEVFPFGGTTTKNHQRIRGQKYGIRQHHVVYGIHGISPTLTSASDPKNTKSHNGYHVPKIEQLNEPRHSNDRVYGIEGVSPTLNTMQGGNRQPFVQVPEATKKGYAEATVGQSINLAVPNSKTRRGRVSDVAQTLDTGMQQHTLTSEAKIRRLTPLECERLQGFPESEKTGIIEVCLDPQQSRVSAVSPSLKSLRLVGSAERNSLQEPVSCVETSSGSSDQQTSKPAQADVLIDCVENGVEIHSQGKLLLSAKGAEKKNWSHLHISIDDFVQLLVGLNTMSEREIGLGGEESHQKEDYSIPLESGLRQENLSGNEITQPVGDAESDSTTLKELLKFTTLDHLSTESSEQRLKTLSLFVTRVINGFIPTEILSQNIFTIEVKTRVGHTYGVSDTQRYKTLGNAVTVNVIRDIIINLT